MNLIINDSYSISKHLKRDHAERFEILSKVDLGEVYARKRTARDVEIIATTTGILIITNPLKSTKDSIFVITMYAASLSKYKKIANPTFDILVKIKRNEAAHYVNL